MSNSNSKTRTNSSKTRLTKKEAKGFQTAAVGNEPERTLTPQDQELYRAFQTNLLSLVSHELRTPLTGIMNALSLLKDADASRELSSELTSMALKNAQKLNHTLSTLLDLMELETGVFHARLQEVNLPRLIFRHALENSDLLHQHGLNVPVLKNPMPDGDVDAILADPKKLGRVVYMILHLLVLWAESGQDVECILSGRKMKLGFRIPPLKESVWDDQWSQALAGFKSGRGQSLSAFSNILQSQDAFLTRTQEGLGSEFILIHEVMRLHRGEFLAHRSGAQVELELTFPDLSSEEEIRAVLISRIYDTTLGVGSLALALIQTPDGEGIQAFQKRVRKALFRASDAVYCVPEKNWLVLIMDDCKPKDAPRLMSRIESTLGQSLKYGLVCCPDEGYDPDVLVVQAQRRLRKS